VCWQIADKDGVDRFLKTLGTHERAQTILGQRIAGEFGAAVGNLELDDLFSKQVDRVEQKRAQLRKKLLDSWTQGDRAKKEYGIKVVDIRLLRTSHPSQVRQAIFQRIISERNEKVTDYESDGDRQAADIASNAEKQRRELLDNAKAHALKVKGEADAEADRIRNQAHAKDPEFYAFLKKLESYRRILGDNKTLLLLSAHRELFDLLFAPPKPNGESAKPKGM
jgi:membrane protease subunit HflC